MKRHFELAAAAASLANLSMMYEWTGLLTFTSANSYLMKTPPASQHYTAGLAAMAILSLVAALWMLWIERASGWSKRLLQWLFLAALLLPANSLRDVLAISHPMLKGELLRAIPVAEAGVLAGLLAVAWMVLAWRFSARFYAAARVGLLLTSPAVLITAGHAIGKAISPPEIQQGAARGGWQERQGDSARVVWVVFDELDEGVLFEYRPADLQVPEFDRLRSESVMAAKATSPSRSTLVSIPSLLMGRQVLAARESAASQLLIRVEGETGVRPLRSEDAIFHQARKEGFNSAVAGWYHPYCRLFGPDLSECAREEIPFRLASMGREFGEIVGNQLRMLFETSLISPFGQSAVTKAGAQSFARLENTALKMVADRRLQFVFLHLQPPHAPHFYNRKRDDYSQANAPISGYLDGVALADKALGRIRRALDEAGLSGRTHLIVTSDHVYRSSKMLVGRQGRHVPFLVHVAGQREGRQTSAGWKTIGTRKLVMGLLRGEISTPEQAAGAISGGGG